VLHGLALVLAGLAAAGCGDAPDSERHAEDAAHMRAVERDPFALTCRDLARQTVSAAHARLVIHAEFALAQVPELRRQVAEQTLNRAGRSVYFALTEVCKERAPSFRPARLAVEGVRRGRYRAARDRPG
jgi:hypothetical protein